MPEPDFAIPGLMPLDHPVYNASRLPEDVIILLKRGDDLRYSIPIPEGEETGTFAIVVWGYATFYEDLVTMDIGVGDDGSTVDLSADFDDLLETERLSFGFSIFRTASGVRKLWRHGFIFIELGITPEDVTEEEEDDE